MNTQKRITDDRLPCQANERAPSNTEGLQLVAATALAFACACAWIFV